MNDVNENFTHICSRIKTYVVIQQVVQSSRVTGETAERAVRRIDSSVVGREEGEARVACVKRVEEADVARLVGRRVVEVGGNTLTQELLETGERVVVGRDRGFEELGEVQNVVDDVEGKVAVCGGVHDG